MKKALSSNPILFYHPFCLLVQVLRRTMSKRNINGPSVMLKKTASIFSACTFVLGYFAGVGFTVYKTISAPSNTTSIRNYLELFRFY